MSLRDIVRHPAFNSTKGGKWMLSGPFFKQLQDYGTALEDKARAAGGTVGDPFNSPMGALVAGDVGAAGGLTAEQLADLAGGDGGGGSDPWGSSEAGVRFQEEQAMARLQAQLAAEAQAKMDELKAKRQQIFNEMLGTDPVRAVLFAMGLSGAVPGSTKEETANLPPLEGIQAYQRNTENALTNVLGKVEGGPKGPVTLTGEGVTGLPSALKAQNVFTTGAGTVGGPSTDVQKLLTSAFGVGHTQNAQAGATGTQTGLTAEEFVRQIQDVTPRGVL